MILDDSADDMMIIAFVTSKRSLMEGLCSSNPCGFKFSLSCALRKAPYETYAYRFCDVSSETIKVPIIITMFWVLQELLLATKIFFLLQEEELKSWRFKVTSSLRFIDFKYLVMATACCHSGIFHGSS